MGSGIVVATGKVRVTMIDQLKGECLILGQCHCWRVLVIIGSYSLAR